MFVGKRGLSPVYELETEVVVSSLCISLKHNNYQSREDFIFVGLYVGLSPVLVGMGALRYIKKGLNAST